MYNFLNLATERVLQIVVVTGMFADTNSATPDLNLTKFYLPLSQFIY